MWSLPLRWQIWVQQADHAVMPCPWPDASAGQKTIVVDRSFTSGQLKVTKNHLRRSVTLVQPLIDDLSECEGDSDLLCPDPDGGFIDLSNWRNRVWIPAVKATGIKAHPV